MLPPMPKRAKFEDDIEKEVKFENWELLPLEIRCMIAKETNVMDRFSLMFSSKSNYDIARSVPIKIESIRVGCEEVAEHPGVDPYKKNIFIELKKYDPSEVITTVCFVEDRNGTMVHRHWKKNERVCTAKTMLLANEKYYDASMSFLEKLMILTDYQVDEFDAGVIDWGYDVVFLDKLQVRKKLGLNSSDGQTFNRWLNTASSPLEKLKIFIPYGYEYPFRTDQFHLNHNTIQTCKEFKILNCPHSLEKLDFFELKCDKFDVYSPEVSPEVVNQFVKRWINGDGPDNFLSGKFSSLPFAVFESDRLRCLDGVNHVPWHYTFKVNKKSLSEAAGFDLGDSNPYYIESKRRDNGAALVLGSFGVLFLVTGKQDPVEESDYY